MPIELEYFAWVRERMGRDTETVDLPPAVATIADLIGWLAARDATGAATFADQERIRAARDEVMATPDDVIATARRIALFPPVTGG